MSPPRSPRSIGMSRAARCLRGSFTSAPGSTRTARSRTWSADRRTTLSVANRCPCRASAARPRWTRSRSPWPPDVWIPASCPAGPGDALSLVHPEEKVPISAECATPIARWQRLVDRPDGVRIRMATAFTGYVVRRRSGATGAASRSPVRSCASRTPRLGVGRDVEEALGESDEVGVVDASRPPARRHRIEPSHQQVPRLP